MGSLNIFDGSAWKPTGVVINNYNIPPASVGLAELKPEVTAEALGGATPPVLLWENASPASEFVPQDISIPTILNYYLIIVCFARKANARSIVSVIFPPKEPNGDLSSFMGNATNGDGQYSRRLADLITGGVHFGEGATYGVATGVDNTVVVPMYIYGIKGGAD